jgi:hypothetical protein
MRQILLAGFLLTSIVTKGQFIKGDKVLGGNFSFFNQDANNQDGSYTNDIKSISLSPRLGFLLSENLAIGGQLGAGFTKQEFATSEYKSKSISAGIYGQRYFNISEKFVFSLLGQFNFTRGQEISPYFDPMLGTTDIKINNYTLTVSMRPTFTFFPSPKWGFDAGIGVLSYSHLRNLSNDVKSNFTSLNFGSITLGVSYYFRNSVERQN